MVGRIVKIAKERPLWASSLLQCNFFGTCGDHRELRKSEKNMFCINCKLSLCKHCISTTHSLHQGLQILKYVYQDVVRVQDIQKHLDSSKIQTYKINGEKAIHLNPRPQTQSKEKASSKSSSKGGLCCEACGRHIQDSFNRFCSIACKFSEACEENGLSSSKESDEEVNTNIDTNTTTTTNTNTNEETESPSSLKEETNSCITASESSKLIAKDGVTNSLLKPNTLLMKRIRKGCPCRSPFM